MLESNMATVLESPKPWERHTQYCVLKVKLDPGEVVSKFDLMFLDHVDDGDEDRVISTSVRVVGVLEDVDEPLDADEFWLVAVPVITILCD